MKLNYELSSSAHNVCKRFAKSVDNYQTHMKFYRTQSAWKLRRELLKMTLTSRHTTMVQATQWIIQIPQSCITWTTHDNCILSVDSQAKNQALQMHSTARRALRRWCEGVVPASVMLQCKRRKRQKSIVLFSHGPRKPCHSSNFGGTVIASVLKRPHKPWVACQVISTSMHRVEPSCLKTSERLESIPSKHEAYVSQHVISKFVIFSIICTSLNMMSSQLVYQQAYIYLFYLLLKLWRHDDYIETDGDNVRIGQRKKDCHPRWRTTNTNHTKKAMKSDIKNWPKFSSRRQDHTSLQLLIN